MFFRSRPTAKNNDALIDQLKEEESVRLKEVEMVMRRVDRGRYVMAGSEPYADRPQSIGFNATISAPHMHAMALEMLLPALRTGKRRRALDVGAGSGYLTVCMALLQGEHSLVVGVEHIPELVAFAEANIRRDQPELLETGRVKIVEGDGRLGFPTEAPFDAIHVGAGAAQTPTELEKQLAPGGRMVVPVGPMGFQQLEVVDRMADGTLKRDKREWVSFVPLTDSSAQWKRPPLPSPRRASVIAEMAAAQAVAVQQGAATPSTSSAAAPAAADAVPPLQASHERRPSFSDAAAPRIRRASLSLEQRRLSSTEDPTQPAQGASPRLSVQGASPRLSVQGASPRLSVQGAASPRLSVQGAASPRLSVQGASPRLSDQGANPRLSAPGASPRLSAPGASPRLSVVPSADAPHTPRASSAGGRKSQSERRSTIKK